MTIIKADRVRLGYNGRSVVNDLSLTVHPGELLGLIDIFIFRELMYGNMSVIISIFIKGGSI